LLPPKYDVFPTDYVAGTDVKATVPKVQEGLKAAALMPESGTNEKDWLSGGSVTPAA
jgi:hypothetical protein